MKIVLTIGEMHLAAHNGTLRVIESIKKGLKDRHGFEGPGWDINVEGAAGEIAAAKAIGTYWGGTVNTFKTMGDVGDLEVRTRSKSYYELIVREGDNSNAIFILVTGQAPVFNVVGWIKASDAKQPKWRKTHGGRPPAYFVPHDALNPIESLKV